jgi:hypothetical protein
MSLATIAAAASLATAFYGGHTSQYAPVGLRVAPDGRTLTGLTLQVDFDCDAGYGASWSGFASFRSFAPATVNDGENVFSPARISRSGRFRATGQAVAAYTQTNGRITEKLRGTVRRGVAHGTYSATLVMTDKQTGATVTTCHSGTVRWQARSAPGRLYAGQSSTGEPIVIERTGSKVRILYVAWTAPCQAGGAWEIGEGLTNFTISRRGHFGDRWPDETKLDGGGSRVRTYTVDGTLRASKASGTFGVQVTDRDAAGTVTDSCDSTLVHWTARSTKGKVKPPKGEIRVGA